VALAILLPLAGLLLAVGFLLWRRRHRWWQRVRRAGSRAAPRHPVVLLHGLLGFDELDLGTSRHEYFRGVSTHLSALGAQVHRPRVGRIASVAARAEQLVKRIEALPAKRVNLVAHSMGGLDARYAIARLGLGGRVASLTTLGTPHRGTPLADAAATLLGGPLSLPRLLAALGWEAGALHDLTTRSMQRFNEKVPDVEGVWYASIVATAAPGELNPLLWPTQRYLWMHTGPNDGLVPTASQAWGEVLGEIEADHWAQIGWSPGFDAAALFEELMRELRGRGF
jgi:triacylglycerol lipase